MNDPTKDSQTSGSSSSGDHMEADTVSGTATVSGNIYPQEGSVNSWVFDEHDAVTFASFDMLIDALSKLGLGGKNSKSRP